VNFIQMGDIHIRVKPELPEDWQMNRYRMLFEETVRLCKEHDAKLFLSGDIADRNRPSLAETKLLIEFFALLSNAWIDTWLISGNHEAIGQGASTFDYFITFFESLNANRRGHINYSTGNLMFHRFPEQDLQFVFLGHPALQRVAEQGFERSDSTTCVLISHFRATINQFIREEIDVANLIAPFDICFVSDVHDPLELHEGKLVYTNNPLNHNFEREPKCGCLLISCELGDIKWRRIPLHLPNLIQISTIPDLYTEPPEDGNFYRVEVKGSTADLRYLTTEQQNVKLLKLPEVAETFVEQEAEVETAAGLVLTDALVRYMEDLGYSNAKVQEMMEVYLEP
jgi:DNA repair exonuclease SbcCD nuclease subunit